MNKQRIIITLRAVFSVVVSIVVVASITSATTHNDDTVTVLASVRPQRIIVVSNKLVIQRVISNTKEDVRPLVVRNSEDGQEMAYTDGIRQQYEAIKQTTDFSKPGVVYERRKSSLGQTFTNMLNRVKHWFQL